MRASFFGKKLRTMIVPKFLCCVIALTLLLFSAESKTMAQSKINTELIVFAAASLTEAFQALARDFEHDHPHMIVRFNFGGSQQLVQQIAHGAQLDLFASANTSQMNIAIKSSRIDSTSVRVFAQNHLVIIVPADNPSHIASLVDLSKAKIKIVLADKNV